MILKTVASSAAGIYQEEIKLLANNLREKSVKRQLDSEECSLLGCYAVWLL
jgi:hypothetical protein